MVDMGKLGIGAISSEIIEAVFRYSNSKKEPIMLIVSKNQIDWDGGYVNNWTTRKFIEYIKAMRKDYPKSKVYICRDHCGPGFKNNDLDDVYKTIDTDIKFGFDLIHVDFSKLNKNYKKILQESAEAIKYIQSKNSDILLEVGTEENRGDMHTDISHVEKEIEFFKSIGPIHFYVTQTGSLVREVKQAGKFNREFIVKLKKILDKDSIKLKEHNGDYMDSVAISQRRNLVDAMNIAPQFGVLQTITTIRKCTKYGVDYSEFIVEAYENEKWKKWLDASNKMDKLLCAIIAGHYVFSGNAYKKMSRELNKFENFREEIIKEMISLISYYSERF